MSTIANGELGLSVRAKLNDALGQIATLDIAVADAQTAAAEAELAAASASATAAALTGFDLEAIAESKAVTAVDVFVYDTSKDSDGGAWRKRTQGTSWYQETLNTATRGSRREFPAVAVIVAEAAKVTIYDGDDPALPMWMVFDSANTSKMPYKGADAITMLNGIMVSAGGSSSGVSLIDFVKDYFEMVYSDFTYSFPNATVLFRNTSQILFSLGAGTRKIVNSTVNDVAMTVLPNAPIDPATGLPVPTIAVATEGGLSVIKDDGTVVDSADTTASIRLAFTDLGLWWGSLSGSDVYFSTNADIFSGDGFGDRVAEPDDTEEFALLTYAREISVLKDVVAFGGEDTAGYAVSSLMLHQPNYTDQSKGMSALLTSTYNTGWMPGNIKGAFLSDTDDTDLVGAASLDDDFSSYADTAAMKAAGWSSATSTGTGDISLVSGAMQLDCDGVDNRARGSRPFTTVVGQEYVVEYSSTANHHFRVGTTENGTQNLVLLNQPTVASTFAYTFVATATTTYVTWEGFNAAGNKPQIDNISVKLADADRSVNNNGLVVTGNITRSPVATGADLVAYSGFSSSNYLEQPYNSALDFGTGDFCVMGWVKDDPATTQLDYVLSRCDTSLSGAEFNVYMNSANKIASTGFGDTLVSSSNVRTNTWNHFTIVRSSNVAYLYLNGFMEDSGAATTDLDNASAILWIGGRVNGTNFANTGSLALLRISATAPTAEQIAKIYNDEKFLFQENAQATLYGTSDAVTALAFDDSTQMLHVGTSAGRSVFQGLRRVENTTTAVGTAISASNGLVVEE